jgi:hypothetical protein
MAIGYLSAPAPAAFSEDDLVLPGPPPAIRDTAAASATAESTSPRRPSARRSLIGDPFGLQSGARLLGLLEELTAIRPHLGWRTSTSSGETAALDWVEGELSKLRFLGALGLEAVDRVTVTADVDLFAPGDFGYLLARIPGRDPSRAVILGAHIDSPNSPGALDDGSGAVTVLEVARILDEARIVPPVDLDLVWFGSHTEGVHMSPSGLLGLGMALAWEGFDVDMIPYGQALTPDDLVDADLVVALPVHDYPSPDGARPAGRRRELPTSRASGLGSCVRHGLSKCRWNAIVIGGRRFVVDDTAQRTMEG